MIGNLILWAMTMTAFGIVVAYSRARLRHKDVVLGPPATLIARRPDISIAAAFDSKIRWNILKAEPTCTLKRARSEATTLLAANGRNHFHVMVRVPAELGASRPAPSLFEELLRLADQDPKAALERIAKLPVEDRFNPLVRFVRVYALGNLIWPEKVDDPEQFFKGLSRTQVRYAAQGVEEIAAIERTVPDFFNRKEMMQQANRVCGPLEYRRPGAVQRALGWTKLLYWLFDDTRFLTLNADHPDAQNLKAFPLKKQLDLIDIRFSGTQLVMSSCLVTARLTQAGWAAGYVLGTRKGEAGGKLSRLSPIGVLTLRDDGRWHIDDWKS